MKEFIVKIVRFCKIFLLHLVSHAAVLTMRGCTNVYESIVGKMKVL
jgi:hypothetical protein